MKKLFLSLISMALAGSVYAQLNTFQEGDVISAEQMNENFQYLADRFGISKATVDCNAGATADPSSDHYTTIMDALVEHNHLTITGLCNEEVVIQGDQVAADISAWPDERVDEGTNFSDFAAQGRHRLVILEGGAGGSASNGIKQAVNNDQIHLVSLRGQISLVISKLRLVGGKSAVDASRGAGLRVVDSYIAGNGRHGLGAWGNVHLTAIGNTIEGTTGTSSGFSCGIQLWGNSFGVLLNNNVDNHPHGGAVCLHQNSSAFVFGNTLSNSRDGIDVRINSSVNVGSSQNVDWSNDIFGNRQGITIEESSAARVHLNKIYNNTRHGIAVYGSSDLTLAGGTKIYGNTEHGIEADSSSINTWCDDNLENPTIFLDDQQANPNGKNAISLGKNATAQLCHLELSGHERGVNAWIGSSLNADSVTIGNNREDGVQLYGAKGRFKNSVIENNGRDGVDVSDGALDLEDSTVQNNVGMGIHANQQSSVNLGRMTAIIGNQDDGIHANASSVNQWGDDEDYLLVKDNWGRGIGLWRGGEGEFNKVHVENNGHGGDASNPDLNKEQGIHVNWNATIKLQGGHVTNSGRDGLGLYGNSVAVIQNNFRIAENNQQGISVSGSDLQIDGAIIENNAEIGISGGHNSKLDLRNTTIRGNSGDGVDVTTKSIIDLSSVEVSSNSGCGIALYRDVYLDVDGQLTISGNTNGSLCMGNDTTLAGNPANLSVDSEISCWSRMWKDPNDPTNPDKNQYSASPTLDLWDSNGASLPPISSNCRVHANF